MKCSVPVPVTRARPVNNNNSNSTIAVSNDRNASAWYSKQKLFLCFFFKLVLNASKVVYIFLINANKDLGIYSTETEVQSQASQNTFRGEKIDLPMDWMGLLAIYMYRSIASWHGDYTTQSLLFTVRSFLNKCFGNSSSLPLPSIERVKALFRSCRHYSWPFLSCTFVSTRPFLVPCPSPSRPLLYYHHRHHQHLPHWQYTLCSTDNDDAHFDYHQTMFYLFMPNELCQWTCYSREWTGGHGDSQAANYVCIRRNSRYSSMTLNMSESLFTRPVELLGHLVACSVQATYP